MPWLCDGCGTEHTVRVRTCPVCGRDRTAPKATRQDHEPVGKPKETGICQLDKTPLMDRGFCPRGNGYPGGWACPFACPLCGQPLAWDGFCRACLGRARGGAPTFPGDRYELEAGHWVKTDPGPRPILPRAQSAQQVQAVIRELAGLEAEETQA